MRPKAKLVALAISGRQQRDEGFIPLFLGLVGLERLHVPDIESRIRGRLQKPAAGLPRPACHDADFGTRQDGLPDLGKAHQASLDGQVVFAKQPRQARPDFSRHVGDRCKQEE